MKKIVLLMLCFMLILTGCGTRDNNVGAMSDAQNEAEDTAAAGDTDSRDGEGNAEGAGSEGDAESTGSKSSEGNTDDASTSDSTDSSFELKGYMDEMLDAADGLPSMLLADPSVENAESYFACLSTVSYEKIHDFIYESSTDTSNPGPELAIVRVKDADDLDEVEKSIREHVDGRITMFENYIDINDSVDKKQLDMLKAAEIFTKDDMAVLIIAENAGDVKKAFEKAAGE